MAIETQAQAWNDPTPEPAMTESEQREYERWLDEVYWQTRAEEVKGEF